jgi:predicted short-subunit dehydrogenase-like oxidoreductase (DUF2520 family)
MDIAVVGAGRVGTALAILLREAGHRIVAVAGGSGTPDRAARYLPGVPVRDAVGAARDAGVVLIGTPDAQIAAVCEAMSRAGALGEGQTVAHLSGATGLEALASARSAGAETLCVHPLQTCPDVESGLRRIPGSAFAITAASDEACTLGEQLARDAGGRPFRLADDAKPIYHAAAVFASNYLIAITALAEELERSADVPGPLGALMPLQRATLDNVEMLGPDSALTGPALRGDAGTVERNLAALAEHAPHAIASYVALADLTLDLAQRGGRISPDARADVDEVLDRWR